MTIFANAQWSVSEGWLETVEPEAPYEIELERIFHTTNRGSQTLYDWPVHMAEKSWVDVSLFNEAFEVALRHHSKASGTPIDETMLSDSLAEARRIARHER